MASTVLLVLAIDIDRLVLIYVLAFRLSVFDSFQYHVKMDSSLTTWALHWYLALR